MDNSDQTRHLGVHHMTATKCEEKRKRKANSAYHLIFVWSTQRACFSSDEGKCVLQKANPLYHTCQPELL